MYSFESLKKFLLDKWWLFALAAIFFIAFSIRAEGIVKDRILSFDPTFFYRFTKYFADWGHLPVWDELSYYVGRADTPTNSILMYMLTGTLYNIFGAGASLFSFASSMAAIYGALIVIPAFLLGRELSNKYGGLFAAALIGTAPQILIRTFGASYDTDQFALFFLLFTLYAGFRCLRKKTIESAAVAILVYSAAMMGWGDSMFTFVILCGYSIALFFAQGLFEKNVEKEKRFSAAGKNLLWNAAFLLAILLSVELIGMITKSYGAIGSIISIASFAQKAEVWIVNISIAELQPFNVFNIEGWMQAMGRFVTSDTMIDMGIFLTFLSFLAVGIFYSYRKNLNAATLMTAIFIIAFYVTTRGIRFTEFSSALFLIIVAAGFGYAANYSSQKSVFSKSLLFGVAFIIVFLAFGISSQLGFALTPDVDENWDNAWKWLKENTPEDSIVGTWWDPGHMISAYAERRNFADGAHCPDTCKYTINDRIVDLGKTMATTDESTSLELIKKYKGTSSKAYWIASDDLIPKYQWLQYFGLGCNYQTDPQKCGLYQIFPLKSEGRGDDGTVLLKNYGNLIMFQTDPRTVIYQQDGKAVLLGEVTTIQDNQIISVEFNPNMSTQAMGILSPLLNQLKLTPLNATIRMTAWVSPDSGYIVAIPPNLRNTVFTKMFFYEGEDLQHFRKVFSNGKVKIYEVDL